MDVTELPGADPEAVQAAVGDAGAILLLSDGLADHDQSLCSTLLSVSPPEEVEFLIVTIDGAVDDVLEMLRSNVGQLPPEVGIIAAGETTRSSGLSSVSNAGPSGVSIDTVADPSDLTGLAMAIGSYLEAWDDTGRTPIVCFHSITSLLFHAGEERAFRFLHATTGRLRDAGARAHYHLDPTAREEGLINAFSALFHAVVDVEPDESVAVRCRR